MNIFNNFRHKLITATQELNSEGKITDLSNIDSVTVEPPRESSHGDLATNAAMVLAKPNNINPRVLAELLINKINSLLLNIVKGSTPRLRGH